MHAPHLFKWYPKCGPQKPKILQRKWMACVDIPTYSLLFLFSTPLSTYFVHSDQPLPSWFTRSSYLAMTHNCVILCVSGLGFKGTLNLKPFLYIGVCNPVVKIFIWIESVFFGFKFVTNQNFRTNFTYRSDACRPVYYYYYYVGEIL
jgi:hypothetical protein